MSVLSLLLIGWLTPAVIMAGLFWAIQRARHNAGIVDIAWSFGTGAFFPWPPKSWRPRQQGHTE